MRGKHNSPSFRTSVSSLPHHAGEEVRDLLPMGPSRRRRERREPAARIAAPGQRPGPALSPRGPRDPENPRGGAVLTALRHFQRSPPRCAVPGRSAPQLRGGAARPRGSSVSTPTRPRPTTLRRPGQDLVVVTPTASGKTLCYNLPVLDSDPGGPRGPGPLPVPDQGPEPGPDAEVHGLIEDLGVDIKTFTFDGDTPEDARRAIRARGHIVVTNPDMLHQGILPHHTAVG